LSKLPSSATPAHFIAFSDAGMTPPLSAITSAFAPPPSAIRSIPGSRRLLHTNHAAST